MKVISLDDLAAFVEKTRKPDEPALDVDLLRGKVVVVTDKQFRELKTREGEKT